MIMLDLKKFSKELESPIHHLEEELKHLQIGRASTWLVEWVDVFVPQYWITQKLNQLANISILDSQTLKIEPWDKSTISAIEKSIRDANLWFNPLNQGDYLLIKIPPLTEERRKELTKIVDKMWEETKIAIRNIRHERRNKVKQLFEEKQISEDEKKNLDQEIDKIVKEFNEKVDKICSSKKEEIMKV